MKKRIVSALLALCLLASLGTLPAAAAGANTARTFSDVTDLDTAAEIESLQLLGVLDGFSDGSFRPAATLTRAQFCKMAVYAMGCGKELGKYSTVTVFPDVKPSHWAASYINLASKGKGIILGFADGYFRPDSKVTYAQAVTILMRQLGYTDADVGGLWPAGYLAEAESIGLTRNLAFTANAALTRGDAAKLFANLLRCGTKDGGAFAATLGETVNNVILVSSNATALDGTAGAMETSDGSVYKMAGKSGSGLLNGRKGTLILDKSGRVMTFIAAATGASRTVTLASASSTQIVDSKGVKYTVTAATETNYNGKAATWGEVYSWLAAGEALTLYLDESGRVTYVLVGGGVRTADAAVIVSANGSTAGFDALAGGYTGYAIYKNGVKISASDLRKNDVAIYSDGAIRVCDTRVNVFYEACEPTPSAPTSITVLGGTKFAVLPTAMDSVAKFKPGQVMTLLLTVDGQVAGAVSGGQGNAVGIVSGGKVRMLCGSSMVAINGTAGESLDGRAVSISASARGQLSLYALSGGAGELDVTKRTVGGRKLSDAVLLFDGGVGTTLAQLGSNVPASRVSYVHTNWAGQADLVVLDTGLSGTVFYGKATVKVVPERFGDLTVDTRMLNVEYAKNGVKAESGSFECPYAVSSGDFVKAVLRGETFTSVTVLSKIAKVSNSAWIGRTAVVADGVTYTVPADVACYNRDSQSWTTLDAARAYASQATLYVEGGTVRIVEVGG